MAIETHTIKVTAETTLDDVLNAADCGPVRIERDGVEYLVYRNTETTTDELDEELAERQRAALRETAGAWKDLDTDEMFAEFYRRRGQEPPSRDLE